MNPTTPISSGQARRSTAALTFDWLMAGLGTTLVGGFLTILWAYRHDQTTGWALRLGSAVLFLALVSSAGALVAAWWPTRRAAPPAAPVLPPGYRLAALGLVLFGIGSLLDLLAGLAGFTENDISGLVSPPRLVQGLGAFLLISGPVRAAAARPASPRPGCQGWGRRSSRRPPG